MYVGFNDLFMHHRPFCKTKDGDAFKMLILKVFVMNIGLPLFPSIFWDGAK